MLGAIGSSSVWAAPPLAVPTSLPSPTETAPPEPVAEETSEPIEASDAPTTESTATAPDDALAGTENEATPEDTISESVVSTPVIQALPGDASDQRAEAAGRTPTAPTPRVRAPTTTSTASPSDEPSTDPTPGGLETSVAAPSVEPSAPTEPASTATEPEEGTDLRGDSDSMLWWFLALIAVLLFGVFGWLYTRRQTAPSAVIERPTVSGAIALKSIEDAKLALTLDVVGATRSLRMFTVDYRLRVANRSARAVRELAVTPELSSARKGNDELRGPAVAHGTGETVRIDRVGPHQSEVITGTVQLPVGEIRPLLQGSKPLFVPIMKVQLRLPGLAPAVHTFIIGLPSATSATRLHPLELDLPPGGLPRLETRKVDT